MISFVFSNPRHHAEILLPVARELAKRGRRCQVVSLAELRGFTTPAWPDLPVARVIPANVRKSPSVGAGLDEVTGGRVARRLLHRLAWRGALAPRLRWLLRDSESVVVPNDAAFPYGELADSLHARALPFVLVQEGIRFPLPSERGLDVYGKGGATAVCCWGDAAAEHFAAVGAPTDTLRITGNPRYDSIDPAAWRAEGDALLAKLELPVRPLLFLSNPIDDQGFCTTEQKYELFESFLRQAGPAGVPIVVKLHPREDAAAFARSAQRVRPGVAVHVVTDASLFAVLAAGRAAVVLASTVGLEALLFGLPLAVLAIPSHGHVFEYVRRDAALPLALGAGFTATLEQLLDGARPVGVTAMLERHLAHRGRATGNVASAVEASLRGEA